MILEIMSDGELEKNASDFLHQMVKNIAIDGDMDTHSVKSSFSWQLIVLGLPKIGLDLRGAQSFPNPIKIVGHRIPRKFMEIRADIVSTTTRV